MIRDRARSLRAVVAVLVCDVSPSCGVQADLACSLQGRAQASSEA